MASARQTLRQITGTSTESVDDAIDRALVVARDQYGEPDWFEVVNTRGFINNGRVSHYQVSLELGYAKPDEGHQPDQYLDSALTARRHHYVSPVIDRRF
tara:strand:- start:1107 stop:1403 length:297 start_codon:yes stop_codon:yes gene_type:complete